MESAYLKPLPITISGQSAYLYLPVFPIAQRLYNIYYSLPYSMHCRIALDVLPSGPPLLAP